MLTAAVLLLPLVGSALLALLPRRSDDTARIIGAVVAGLTFVLSLFLLGGLGGGSGAPLDPRHELDLAWAPGIGVRFHIGVDGISVPLVLLTTLLCFLCTLHTWVERVERPAAFLSLVLLLEVGALGTFVALDLVLFFAAFEVVLVPMYFLIARWGGAQRAAAALKFVLYTLIGSAFVIVGLLLIYAETGTFDLVELSAGAGAGIGRSTQILAFVALFLGFAVKSPMWPLHTWLPPAHTEAPTVGSVLLAGVLLKMGTYGLIRLGLPVLPEGARAVAPLLAVLAVAGIVVAALACYTQTDLKRLIAYSSVGHMGFVLLGIATLTPTGLDAALLGNVAHGVVTGLLFLLVGAVKARYLTGDLDTLGSGLGARLPRLGFALSLGCIASLGLPGLAGFWGEALAVFAALNPDPALPQALYAVLAVIAAAAMVLVAAYFLRLLRRLVVGPDRGAPQGRVADVWALEGAVWAPLVVLTVVLGLYPRLVLGLTEAPVDAMLAVFG